MTCTASTVAAIRQPAGPAHYQAGEIALADGTTVQVWGDLQGRAFLKDVRTGDAMQVCFARPRRWADAPPEAAAGFAVDMRTDATYSALGVPGSNAQTFPPGGAKRRTL